AGRFVVQVGAFSEATSARQVRQRVEKLGLKTYTQVVETAAGKRIRVRVGPYGERGEADRAAARLKQAGLQPAVLTL
nr:SPOR domain-containing protein [Methylibium sp.]